MWVVQSSSVTRWRFWSRIKILIKFTRMHKCFYRVVAYQNHSWQRYDQCLSSLLRLCVRSVCSFPMKLLIKSNFGKLCYLCYHQVLMSTSSYLFREKNTVLIFGKLNYYLPETRWSHSCELSVFVYKKFVRDWRTRLDSCETSTRQFKQLYLKKKLD